MRNARIVFVLVSLWGGRALAQERHIQVGGYVQSDGRGFLGDDADALTDQFLVRSVRGVFEASFRRWELKLVPDFGQGKAVLQDASVDAHLSGNRVRMRAGKLKAPFGLERLKADTLTSFLERAYPTNLAPNRDLGIQIHGEVGKGLLSYALGVFDGVPDGGSSDGDSDDDKDLVARVFTQPLGRIDRRLRGLGFGAAVTWGKRKGSTANPQVATYKTSGQNTFFSYNPAAIGDGAHLRGGLQGHLYMGPLGLLGEVVWSRQAVKAGTASADLTHRAWVMEAAWVITGEPESYKAVIPRRRWGAVEVAARFHETRIDREAFSGGFADSAKSARRARAFALGVNWYADQVFRLSLDFERTSFRWGAAGGDRPAENLLGVRAQAVF